MATPTTFVLSRARKSYLLSIPLRSSPAGRTAVVGSGPWSQSGRPAVVSLSWSVSLMVISFGDTAAGAAEIRLLLECYMH